MKPNKTLYLQSCSKDDYFVMKVSLTWLIDGDWLTLSCIVVGYDSNGIHSTCSVLWKLDIHTLLRGLNVLSKQIALTVTYIGK